MNERDQARESHPIGNSDELGGLRGVVVDETTAVSTVTEPPQEPAQPPETT